MVLGCVSLSVSAYLQEEEKLEREDLILRLFCATAVTERADLVDMTQALYILLHRIVAFEASDCPKPSSSELTDHMAAVPPKTTLQ